MSNPYKGLGLKRDQYWKASERALKNVDAAIGQAQGDLNSFVAGGDRDSAAATVQTLADLARQKENLQLLRHQYASSKAPPQQPPQSAEAWQHKAPEAMNFDDALQVFKTSKYGADLDWKNKDVQAGYQEAMRRRRRGE